MMESRRSTGQRLSVEALETRLVLATFVVDTQLDNNDGNIGPFQFSLREAIELSNQTPGVDTINFRFGGTYNLNMTADGISALVISDSVLIEGPGSSVLTINAAPLDPDPGFGNGARVLDIEPGLDVTISGVSLSGGDTSGSGGALRNQGNLSLDDVTVHRNTALSGGGGLANFAEVTISNSEFRANRSLLQGGGIFNSRATATVSDSLFVGNDGRFSGGAVLNDGGTLEVQQSFITGNGATSGGGIANRGAVQYDYYYNPYTMQGYFYYTTYTGSAEVRRTSITGNAAADGGGLAAGPGSSTVVEDTALYNNFAQDSGGAIYLSRDNSYPFYSDGDALITNSTISGNTAGTRGAGIIDYSPLSFYELSIGYSTITNNFVSAASGAGTGGGVYLDSGSQVRLEASIVAGNERLGGFSSDMGVTNSTPLVARQNLIGDGAGSGLNEANPDANGNLVGGPVHGPIDPKLAPLANNGGPTATHALFGTSPAIDRVIDQGNAPVFDQRGFARSVGVQIDMGAFESSGIDGDLDDNGFYECADIDALVADIASGGQNPALFDLNGDTVVNLGDVNLWLAEAGDANLPSGNAFLRGDANLDGLVNGADFLIWNANKFTPTAAWCSADFNADGNTDGQDFVIWNQHKFSSATIVDSSAPQGIGTAARPLNREIAVTSGAGQATPLSDRPQPGFGAHRDTSGALVESVSGSRIPISDILQLDQALVVWAR